MTPTDVTTTTAYLTRQDRFGVNQVYIERLGAAPPARTTIQVRMHSIQLVPCRFSRRQVSAAGDIANWRPDPVGFAPDVIEDGVRERNEAELR